MKTSKYPMGATRPAFTLIEIITVMAIIMALAAMVISGMGYATKKADINRAEILIETVSLSLGQYRADNDVFPEGDGEKDSTQDVYSVLYGDLDGDGKPDDGVQVYLSLLNPDNKGKSSNVRESGDSYVVVDPWKSQSDPKIYQELFYRHDPDGNDILMMNPPTDFDLWSLGPDGIGGPQGTKEDRTDDIINW